MQHPKWQQRRANLRLEPEYVRRNLSAYIVQVCFRRSQAKALLAATKATQAPLKSLGLILALSDKDGCSVRQVDVS